MVDLPRTGDYKTKTDWDNDGDFDEPLEDFSAHRRAEGGITVSWGRDQDRSLAPPMINTAHVLLDNSERQFSSEWAGSAVYQLMKPGRYTEFSVNHGTRTQYRKHETYRSAKPYRGVGVSQFFHGYTENITHNPSLNDETVSVPFRGTMGELLGRKVNVSLREGIRTDQAITLLLDAAGWPGGKRIINPGNTILLYWWAHEADVWAALLQMLESEGMGAVLYEDLDGNIVFENRNHRTVNARSVTSQATFMDSLGGEKKQYNKHELYRKHQFYRGYVNALVYSKLSHDPAWHNIVNRATYEVNARIVDTTQVVWQYGTQLILGANATAVIPMQGNEVFKDGIAPVAGTDFIITAGSVASVTIDWTDGQGTNIRITAGAGGATLSGLQMRAKPLTIVGTTIIPNSLDMTVSQDEFKIRDYEVKGWPDIDPNQAVAVCNTIVQGYSKQRPQVKVIVPNVDAAHMRKMLYLRISDRITVINQHLGLSVDLFVESLQHRVHSAAQIHELTLGCEYAVDLSGAVWDVGQWDISTWGS